MKFVRGAPKRSGSSGEVDGRAPRRDHTRTDRDARTRHGPIIGLWDYQKAFGRGDAKVIPGMWYSAELQVTTPVPEWNGHPVRVAQEEDFIIGADGKPRWAIRRQSEYHIVK
jgi:hypothetical protein